MARIGIGLTWLKLTTHSSLVKIGNFFENEETGPEKIRNVLVMNNLWHSVSQLLNYVPLTVFKIF